MIPKARAADSGYYVTRDRDKAGADSGDPDKPGPGLTRTQAQVTRLLDKARSDSDDSDRRGAGGDDTRPG